MANSGRELEILVTKIQTQLSPDAEVLHDVRLMGHLSKRKRQIDVLVRQKIGQYEMLIVLDCKDYARPVDVKGVEEFQGLLADVGAHKGALVCPKGFSEAAKTRAEGLKIDLFSPADTDPHKWQIQARMPAICDFREAMYSFGISMSSPLPFTIPADVSGFFNSVIAHNKEKKELGVPAKVALQRWEKGEYPTDPGEHGAYPVFDEGEVLVDNGHGMLAPVNLTVSLLVKQSLYYGELPVKQLSGFKDELSGDVIANAFTIGLINPNTVEKEWTPIASKDDLPRPPALTLIGLIGYEG